MNNTQYRQVFTRLEALPAGTDSFARCRFENCRLPGAVLNGLTFEDCLFFGCDLSLAQVTGTAFKNVVFEECNLQGLPLYACARWLLAVRFKKCMLRFASFAGLPLKKTVFEECDLREASFVQTLLQEASFVRCDLTHASFLHTHLEKTDFTTSFGLALDPETNCLRGARFSVYSLPGLLTKYGIVTDELS